MVLNTVLVLCHKYLVFGSHDKDQDSLFLGPLGGGHWMPLLLLESLQAGRP